MERAIGYFDLACARTRQTNNIQVPKKNKISLTRHLFLVLRIRYDLNINVYGF